MKATSALLYECTAEEARSLPGGFQFLEYDTLYGSLRIMTAGESHVREDKRFVYLCYKMPPANWESPHAGKPHRVAKRKAPRTAGSAATCSAPIAETNAGKGAHNGD